MKKHKWHKEIKAWADGAEIEHRYVGHSDYFKQYKNWNTDELHNFFTDGCWEYRIKPQPKEPQYLYVYTNTIALRFSPLRLEETDQQIYVGKIKLEVEDGE